MNQYQKKVAQISKKGSLSDGITNQGASFIKDEE